MASSSKAFLVILGDINNSYYNSMLANMRVIGDIRQILDNTFVLFTKEEMNYDEVRNVVTGEVKGYCIVIVLDGLKAAWNLEVPNNKYFSSLFIKQDE